MFYYDDYLFHVFTFCLLSPVCPTLIVLTYLMSYLWWNIHFCLQTHTFSSFAKPYAVCMCVCVQCMWVFSIWFVKFSKLSVWNEFMPFPGAPSAGPTSHNEREEGGRELTSFSTLSGSFSHRRSRLHPSVIIAAAWMCCWYNCSDLFSWTSAGSPDSPLALTVSTFVTPKTLETRHQNTDRLERGAQSKITSS